MGIRINAHLEPLPLHLIFFLSIKTTFWGPKYEWAGEFLLTNRCWEQGRWPTPEFSSPTTFSQPFSLGLPLPESGKGNDSLPLPPSNQECGRRHTPIKEKKAEVSCAASSSPPPPSWETWEPGGAADLTESSKVERQQEPHLMVSLSHPTSPGLITPGPSVFCLSYRRVAYEYLKLKTILIQLNIS